CPPDEKMFEVEKSIGPAAQYQRGVDASEGKVVAHDVIGLQRTAAAAEVVKVGTTRVDAAQIDGGSEPALTHHLQGHPRLQRTAGAQGVPHVALEGADGHAVAKDREGG